MNVTRIAVCLFVCLFLVLFLSKIFSQPWLKTSSGQAIKMAFSRQICF